MSAATRIAGFAVALAIVFAAAAVAGAKLDPSVDETDDAHTEESEEMIGHSSNTSTAATTLPGLATAEAGLRLAFERTEFAADRDTVLRFAIIDADGAPVRDYDVEHEREMHLIVVRRDFTEFQHLHPRLGPDGVWEAPANLEKGGVYRAFADFATAGESLTLASDISVAGRFEPQPLPAPAPVADAGDGYEVSLDSAEPLGGGVTPLQFTVTRNGRELDAIEPYLGADGHLVALREHDLAFLHTHPEGEPGGPGPIEFGVEYPTEGSYRLYLQFKHRGEVHTAAFTQRVSAVAPAETAEEATDADH